MSESAASLIFADIFLKRSKFRTIKTISRQKLNELAADLNADRVLLEIGQNGYPMFKFRWFPYTMVKSHFELCWAFVAKLVEKAAANDGGVLVWWGWF